MDILIGGVTLSFPLLLHYLRQQRRQHNGPLRALHWPHATSLRVPVPVHVLSTRAEIEAALLPFATDAPPCSVLGLDTEWKPNQTKGELPHPVAVLQIATAECVYVIQLLPHCSGALPPALVSALENPNIIKVGVGIYQDAKKMRRDYQVNLRGCVDLLFLAARLFPHLASAGLKAVTEFCTDLSFVKEKPIQLSDWSVTSLSDAQVSYAAADAWAGLLTFENLLFHHLRTLDLPLNLSEWWKQGSLDPVIRKWTAEYCDRKFVPPATARAPVQSGKSSSKSVPAEGAGEESSRRTPLYEGCEMVDPDGSHVAWCNRDKLQWYLEKDLATLVPDTNPPVIQLKFFPSGKGSRPYASEGQQSHHQLTNCCVICGNTESYRKFYIVPRTYRSFFPHNEKFHCSHDIVLLCPSCHYLCSERFETHKAEYVALEYHVPMSGVGAPFLIDKEAAMVASCAKQLKRNRRKMNATQIEETEKRILTYFQADMIDSSLIDEACALQSKVKNPEFLSHGEAVVRRLQEDPHGIQQFAVMWRRFFEREMSPKHLPAYWDVNHEWEEHHGNGQRIHPFY